jgi:hypothetical protein
MLKELGTWYFDYGWIITTVAAFPLGGVIGLTKNHRRNMLIAMAGLLALGLIMLYFKHME